MEGWIRLHRKLLDNPISKNPKYSWLWVVLLLLANHEENEFLLGNQLIKVRRGQFITGRKQLSKQSGIKEGTVETILDFLEIQHQIQQQKTSKYRLITIINYDRYQPVQQVKLQQIDNRLTTELQQNDTNNNDKNEKNDNNEELYMPNKKPNGLRISRSQLIAFLKEFPGLTTSEAKEQVLLCNNYMAISSVVYTNPGLFFRGWLKRYMTEKKKKEYLEKKERESIVNLPEVSEEQAKQNIERLTKLKEELKIKGVIS